MMPSTVLDMKKSALLKESALLTVRSGLPKANKTVQWTVLSDERPWAEAKGPEASQNSRKTVG